MVDYPSTLLTNKTASSRDKIWVLTWLHFMSKGIIFSSFWCPFIMQCIFFLSLFWPPKLTLGLSVWGGRFPEPPWARWFDYLIKHAFSLLQFDFLEAFCCCCLFSVLHMRMVSFFSNFLSACFCYLCCCYRSPGFHIISASRRATLLLFLTHEEKCLPHIIMIPSKQRDSSKLSWKHFYFSLLFAFQKILKIKSILKYSMYADKHIARCIFTKWTHLCEPDSLSPAQPPPLCHYLPLPKGYHSSDFYHQRWILPPFAQYYICVLTLCCWA